MCEDIQPNWRNVARRCQSVVSNQQGFAVVEIRMLVAPGGEPVFWLEPKMHNIEPLGGAAVFLHQIMERING